MSTPLPRVAALVVVASITAGLATAGCLGEAAKPTTPDDGGTGTDSGTGSDAGKDGTIGNDGSTPADGGKDGALEAGPACDPSKAFGAPLPVLAVNTSATEDGAWPTPSGLELYVGRREPNNDLRIYRYTRPDTLSPWTVDGVKTELFVGTASDGGSPGASTQMVFTPDGNTAYLAVYKGNTWNVFTSTRASAQAPWQKPVVVNGLDTSFDDEAPWLNAKGDRLYFMSNRGGGAFRIWTATKSVTGFAAPTAVGAIRAPEDRFPVLSSDELTLYFASYDSPPDGGSAQMLTYKATRGTTSQPFANPVYVNELNAYPGYTKPIWLSADGCEILLTATRQGSGGFDVYGAKKPL